MPCWLVPPWVSAGAGKDWKAMRSLQAKAGSPNSLPFLNPRGISIFNSLGIIFDPHASGAPIHSLAFIILLTLSLLQIGQFEDTVYNVRKLLTCLPRRYTGLLSIVQTVWCGSHNFLGSIFPLSGASLDAFGAGGLD